MEYGLPPGPRWPSLAQGLAFLQLPRYLAYCHRRFGDRFTVRLGNFGTFVYLVDPADIKEVLRADDDLAHAGEANAEFLGPILGSSSVLCTDEEQHRRQRRNLSGPFHGSSVTRLAPVMEEIAAADVETWPIGEEFAVLPHMRRITLEVILRTVLGADTDDRRRLGEIRDTLADLVDINLVRMAAFVFPPLAKVWPWSRHVAVQEKADSLLYSEIERRRNAADLAERNDVLSMLVRDSGSADMTTTELRDQLVTLLVAGHETTATGLAWTFERLVRHPVALAKAARAATEGDDEYLDAVVTESLRVRPVVPDITRRLTRDATIGEGDRQMHLPAGTCVDPAICLVMRDERRYPDPWVFDPERFVGKKPDTNVWLPFGGGGRRCLGAAFALTEMRVILSSVLRSVELATTSDRQEGTRVRHVTLVPKRGARIRVLRRSGPAGSPAGLDAERSGRALDTVVSA